SEELRPKRLRGEGDGDGHVPAHPSPTPHTHGSVRAGSRISTVINVLLEVDNALRPSIEYLHIPVPDVLITCISACFDAVTDRIRSVGSCSVTICMAYLMKHHAVSLVRAHAWVRACWPIIWPNNSFWQQLIQYEYELFRVNTVRMVRSPLGVIPNVYKAKVRMVLLWYWGMPPG
uniref:Dual specificity phosphatase 21 n=1 Tax=Anser brachyrhynchus TaxID=132585 RepID=A0A8B9CNQ9_9AVES